MLMFQKTTITIIQNSSFQCPVHGQNKSWLRLNLKQLEYHHGQAEAQFLTVKQILIPNSHHRSEATLMI